MPVVQLSLQPELGTAHHVALGRALAPLADDGVLIVGSGHTTHNLRDWIGESAAQRAAALRAGVRRLARRARSTAHDTTALVDYRERAPDAARAHPTEEHFLPLHVAWGAAGDDPRVERIVDGLRGGRAGARLVRVPPGPLTRDRAR